VVPVALEDEDLLPVMSSLPSALATSSVKRESVKEGLAQGWPPPPLALAPTGVTVDAVVSFGDGAPESELRDSLEATGAVPRPPAATRADWAAAPATLMTVVDAELTSGGSGDSASTVGANAVAAAAAAAGATAEDTDDRGD
jgi:hypothetical protein